MTIEELAAELVRLSKEEQAYLAEVLLASLGPSDPGDYQESEEELEVSPALAAELERRANEMAEGRVQAIPWETVHAELREKLERLRESRNSPSREG